MLTSARQAGPAGAGLLDRLRIDIPESFGEFRTTWCPHNRLQFAVSAERGTAAR